MARVATSAAIGEPAAASIAGAYLPLLIAVAALYFVTAWISDRLLTFVGDADLITPVWLPSGVALAALLLFGYRYWPAILLSAGQAEQAQALLADFQTKDGTADRPAKLASALREVIASVKNQPATAGAIAQPGTTLLVLSGGVSFK